MVTEGSFSNLGRRRSLSDKDKDPDTCPPEEPPQPPAAPWLFPVQKSALEAIKAICKPGGSVVITGSLGVGKTRVAREAAKWLKEVNPQLKIIEINANVWTDFEGRFKRLADQAGQRATGVPEYLRQDLYRESGQHLRLAQRRENLERFQSWFSNEKRMWCVIVDRADDGEVLFGRKEAGAREVRGLIDYLPKVRNTYFLFTTRSQQVADSLFEISTGAVRVSPPAEADALSLFEKGWRWGYSATRYRRLAKLLEYNPLAITEIILASGNVNTVLMSETKEGMPLAMDPELRAVLLTLSATDPQAMDFLAMLSFFHHRDIPLCLFASPKSYGRKSGTDKDKELRTLSRLHLITTSYTYCDTPSDDGVLQRGIDVLPAVQTAVLDWLEARGELENHKALFLKRLAQAFEPSSMDFKNVEETYRHQRLVPHGKVAFRHPPTEDGAQQNWAFVVYSTGRYIHEKAEPVGDMIKMMKKVSDIQELQLGVAHEETLASLHLLALLHRVDEKGTERIGIFRRILLARKSMDNQLEKELEEGEVKVQPLPLHELNGSTDASLLLLEAFAQFEKMIGSPNRPPLVASSREELTRKQSDAADMIEQLIDILRKESGEPDAETPRRLHRFATLLLSYGVLRRAEELFLQSISMLEKSLGTEDLLTLACKASLINTLLKRGRWWKAQGLSVTVMEAYGRVLGEDHSDTLAVKTDHATTFAKQEQWEEAEPLIRSVIEASERVLGREHRSTLERTTQLGELLCHLERWEEAEGVLMSVVEKSGRVLGDADPATWESTALLAAAYAAQSQWERAEGIVYRVIQSHSWKQGEIYPDTLETILTLAPLFREGDRRDFAVLMLTSCIQVQEFAFGQNLPELTSSQLILKTWKREDGQAETNKNSSLKDEGIFSGEPLKEPVLSLWHRCTNFFYPPEDGYVRVFFICGCGELLSMDVRELLPGGVERLRKRLQESSAAVRSRAGPGNASGGSGPTMPQPVHFSGSTFGSSSTPSGGPSNAGDGTGQPSQAQTANDPSGRTANKTQQTRNPAQYLLVCIQSDLMVLAQISVAALTNDEYLFKRIREEYEAVRRRSAWRISILVPRWLSQPWDRFVAWLPDFPRVATAFRALKRAWGRPLHQVSTGDFVQFNLIPVRMRLSPSGFKTKKLPPPKEVEEQRYLYDPVEIEVEYADIPLNHLMKPGRHFDDFWLTTFPKKIGSPLVRRAGGGRARHPCIGWGIRVNEKLDKKYVLWMVHKLLVLILVGSVLYGYFLSNWGDSWGLGSLLVAIVAIWLPFQYLAWSDESGKGSNEPNE